MAEVKPANATDAAVARRTAEAAERARAEAEARRKSTADAPAAQREIGGRDGPEPVRYGDWEVKGRASDF
jgi:hypothetical protein